MVRRTTQPKSKIPSAVDASRAQNVLLESLSSQMTMVLEAVTSSKTELKAEIRALESRLSERISVLEEVVRQNTKDIRALGERVTSLSEEVDKLRAEVTRLRYDFDHREERGRLGALEARVATLESRLGVSSR